MEINKHMILKKDDLFLKFLQTENEEDFLNLKKESSMKENQFFFQKFSNFQDIINYANTSLKTNWNYNFKKDEFKLPIVLNNNLKRN